MSAHVYLNSVFDRLRVKTDDLDPVLIVEAMRDGILPEISVSLHLNLTDIERIETALAALRMNLAARDAQRAEAA
jgi:hypothetical protein